MKIQHTIKTNFGFKKQLRILSFAFIGSLLALALPVCKNCGSAASVTARAFTSKIQCELTAKTRELSIGP
jgi:hypothetical protein